MLLLFAVVVRCLWWSSSGPLPRRCLPAGGACGAVPDGAVLNAVGARRLGMMEGTSDAGAPESLVGSVAGVAG